MNDELRRMNITGWSPATRAIIRAALLKSAAVALHHESVEAVRIVRLIDEVNEGEDEDAEVARLIDEASGD